MYTQANLHLAIGALLYIGFSVPCLYAFSPLNIKREEGVTSTLARHHKNRNSRRNNPDSAPAHSSFSRSKFASALLLPSSALLLSSSACLRASSALCLPSSAFLLPSSSAAHFTMSVSTSFCLKTAISLQSSSSSFTLNLSSCTSCFNLFSTSPLGEKWTVASVESAECHTQAYTEDHGQATELMEANQSNLFNMAYMEILLQLGKPLAIRLLHRAPRTVQTEATTTHAITNRILVSFCLLCVSGAHCTPSNLFPEI